MSHKLFIEMAKQEGWSIATRPKKLPDGSKVLEQRIIVHEGSDSEYDCPIAHPFQVHLKGYNLSPWGSEQKLLHMIAAKDLLWPQYIDTWNHWSKRRFEAHCSNYTTIVMAGGANIGKSFDMAQIALLFYLSDTKNNACVIASTTLESLENRIWGYVTKLLNEAKLILPVTYVAQRPPKILNRRTDRRTQLPDTIHGLFAVAAKTSENEEKTIANIIGRHPNKRLMVCLDECTDMPTAIINAKANLEKGGLKFQLWGIGNSNSKNDLHGSLATPAVGWDKVTPDVYAWETATEGGICLYFNPYDSPAIVEKNEKKKEKLSRIFVTSAGIADSERKYGKDSNAHWRFCLGFWRKGAEANILTSAEFLEEAQVRKYAEWSGARMLQMVAGLDPALQTGGDGCILRLGILGYTTEQAIVLDFRQASLMFKIEIEARSGVPSEIQVADRVIEILVRYGVRLSALAIDCTGLGRALAGLIQVRYKELYGIDEAPIRIHSAPARQSFQRKKDNDPNLIVSDPTELWMNIKKFIDTSQIRGLDEITIQQLVNRKVDIRNGKLIIETKKEFKARMQAAYPSLARSPDEADSAILALHAAILRYGFSPGQRLREEPVLDHWSQKMRALMMQQDVPNHPASWDQEKRLVMVPEANFSAGVEDLAPIRIR
jgi:hypothetical protein